MYPGSEKTGRDKNTPQYVVDASVIAKWVLPGEPFQEKALRLKEDHVSGVIELSAPSIIVQEVANALWRATKLNRISEADAKEALKALNDMRIELHEPDWIQTAQALSIACDLDLTIYDASYVFLTHELKVPLITADKTLYETARKSFKILHIKDYL
ncbi:MAG: Ribonuclease VapC3 [Candidatus Bathyarchaeota archaeon BA2]|nr:MAG: Ribonuclease VapC3 [Candidatus Bathyarchaeota archaeon BA2]